ncbi:unnamed protein product [Caenorhabditis angaria]|uniref:TIL domain-containing protein n=1 Tax=Caenorhabditis angaria TaxID=860376 RepID=A0A9P1MSZ9_9PELO|nr:unnamed protein product [Caenorhabditis angaria]
MVFSSFVYDDSVSDTKERSEEDRSIERPRFKYPRGSVEVKGYCPRHEKYEECGTGCERTCPHPNQPSSKNCRKKCIPYKCTCAIGYYRDNRGTGRCVLPKDCKAFGKEWHS